MQEYETHNDDFDAFLRKGLANSAPYIPDNGFASSVTARLPRRRWIQVAPVVAAVLMLLVIGLMVPWLSIATQITVYTLSLDWVTLLKLATYGSMLMLAAAGVVMAREAKVF